jgi:hypothetical protein
MEPSHKDYRYLLRKYPRRAGMIWRWWIFEGKDANHSDTGVVVEADRDTAEAAAKNAIEQRLRRIPPPRRPGGVVPGVVGHNSPEDPVVSGRRTRQKPTTV